MLGPSEIRRQARPLQVALHADDFGMNEAVNRGILRGFRQGPLTSTSLLANAPGAVEAIAGWKQLLADLRAGDLPSSALRQRLGDAFRWFDLGVHLNLTQGKPLTGDRYPHGLLDDQGRFPSIATLMRRLQRGAPQFHAAVERELSCQVEMLLDHGLTPTHLNGHQYIEMVPALGSIVTGLVERFRVCVIRLPLERSLLRNTLLSGFPLRTCLLAGVKRAYAARFRVLLERFPVAYPDKFFGTAHAGRIDMRLMRNFLGGRDRSGMVEIGLHPAEQGPPPTPAEVADGWDDPLCDLRPRELELLLSDEFHRYLQGQSCGLGRLADLAA